MGGAKLKKFWALSVLMVLTLSACAFAVPADFPERNVKILVPFAPGGGTDTLARILSRAAGKKYFGGHSIVVENMGGGGGAIGHSFVANTAPADGYTVMLFTNSCINNTLLKKVNYSYKDFKPIIGCNPDAELLAVPVDSPIKDLKDLVELARKQNLKVATPGHTSLHHILAMNMARLMGLNFVYIHNQSAAMQLSQLMGGHCDLAYMTISEGSSAVRSGKARGIGIMAKERNEAIPDVPTFKEQGLDGWIDGANRGLACHVDVPDDRYRYLVEEFNKIVSSEEYIDAMKKANMVSGIQTPEEYQRYIDHTAEGIMALKPELLKKN
jgi:tripartite-type tricarboxylate transporter receptor subunit TctC